MTGKTDYYNQQLIDGKKYQKFVVKTMREQEGIEINLYETREDQYNIGESREGYEIKFDKIMQDTGRIYIETAEKTNPNNSRFVDSGIFRNDNTEYWLIGDYTCIFLILKDDLIEIYKNKKYWRLDGNRTSKGFLLTRDHAKKIAKKTIIPIPEESSEEKFFEFE